MATSYLSADDRNPELCVIDKFLSTADVAAIVAKLKANSSKKRIVLKGNCLGHAGAQELAAYLKENSTIEVLSLEWNQLGNDGAAELAKAIETCGLKELDLRNNNIKSEGAAALAKSIMVNSTITSLDLRWNQIEDSAALLFKEALQDRVPKLNLTISGNLLSSNCASVLDRWMGKEQSMESAKDVGQISERDSGSGSGSGAKREFTGPSAAAEAAQSTILQKETALLRSQNTVLQGELRDLQRQLDSAAVRVTELEQQFLKEEHRSAHISEQLKTATMRVSALMEELKNLNQAWEMDRQANTAELRRVVGEREDELRTMGNERDKAKGALQKAEDKATNLQIQLEQLTRHTDQERKTTEEELSSALHQITDLTTSEARMRSENAILKNAENRFNERIKQLEAEVESTKRQAQADLEAEFKARSEEMDRLRAEQASLLSVAQEKAARQSRELAELYKKHAELQSEASTQRVEMQEKADAAVAAVRESEAKRCESTVAEFRSRLDAYLTSRAAIEVRCEGLSRELKVAQEQHMTTSTQLEKQIKEMDQELRRLREQKLSMEATLATSQKDCQTAVERSSEAHKKLLETEGRLEETRRSLHDCVLERGNLRSEVGTLKQMVDKLELQRKTEFAAVSDHLTLNLKKELAALASTYRIEPPPPPSAEEVAVAGSPGKSPKPSTPARR